MPLIDYPLEEMLDNIPGIVIRKSNTEEILGSSVISHKTSFMNKKGFFLSEKQNEQVSNVLNDMKKSDPSINFSFFGGMIWEGRLIDSSIHVTKCTL